jgi:hypothetical protein
MFASVGILSPERDEKGYRKIAAHYVIFSPGRIVRNDESTHGQNKEVTPQEFESVVSFAHEIGFKVLYSVSPIKRPTVWAHVEIKRD